MHDFLRVGNEEAGSTISSSNDWMDLLDGWIKGSGVSPIARDIRVYPNLISWDEHLNTILNVSGNRQYRDMFIQYGNIENKIHLGALFDRLTKLELRMVQPMGPFDFDARVRRAIEGKYELEINSVILEKVAVIADAIDKSSLPRISRSILQNPIICRELGVPDDYLISPFEYRSHLMLPLRHWHQMAFASAYESGAICNETKVRPNASALDNAIAEITDAIQKSDLHAWYTVSHDFSKMSFCDILAVRSRQVFNESLRRLDEAVGKSNAEFINAFDEHWGVVRATLRWKLRRPERSQLDNLFDEGRIVISPEPLEQIILSGTKLLLSLGPNILSNLQRELQFRWFFRQVSKTQTNVTHT